MGQEGKALKVLRFRYCANVPKGSWFKGSKVRAIDTYRLSILAVLYNQK